MVLRPIVVAHDGCRAFGIAEKDPEKDELHIHNDTVCRHAVLADILHQLVVVAYREDAARDAGKELTHAVGDRLPQGLSVEDRADKMQQRLVGQDEEKERHQATHRRSDESGPCRTAQAHVEDHGEEIVQKDVEQA